MAYQQEAVSGVGGVFLGAIFPPNESWFNHVEFHDVWVFVWPFLSGALMALGTHLTKKGIEYYNKKKKEREK